MIEKKLIYVFFFCKKLSVLYFFINFAPDF